MTSIRIQFKSFHKKQFNPGNFSLNKLSQSSFVGSVNKKQIYRHFKTLRTEPAFVVNNAKTMRPSSHRVLKNKNRTQHQVIYNQQIRKLKNLDLKIQQQIQKHQRQKLQKQTELINQAMQNEFRFQLDKYIFMNRYSRNFELIQHSNKHTDISLTKLIKNK